MLFSNPQSGATIWIGLDDGAKGGAGYFFWRFTADAGIAASREQHASKRAVLSSQMLREFRRALVDVITESAVREAILPLHEYSGTSLAVFYQMVQPGLKIVLGNRYLTAQYAEVLLSRADAAALLVLLGEDVPDQEQSHSERPVFGL